MIELKSVSAKNFLSFGNKPTKLDLTNLGTTLIVGDNQDIGESGSSKNGVGKTAGINAIIYAIYGKGIDKELKASDYINLTNGKNLEVVLEFSIGKDEYKIIRKRKPNGVELYHNGESLTLDSMKNTDELIENLVGISYEVFMMTYFMAPHKKSFMAMSGVEQRSMIEEILSLETLVERADTLKAIKKELDVDLKLINRDLENAESTNEKASKMMTDLKEKSDKFSQEIDEEIQSIEEGISELKHIDFNNLEEILDILNESIKNKDDVLSELNHYIDKKRSTKELLSEAESDLKSIESEKRTYLSIKDKSDNFGKDTQKKIDSQLDKLHGYHDSSVYHEQIELVETYNQTVDEIKGLKKHIDEHRESLKSVEDEIKSMEEGVCHYCGQSHYDEDKLEELIDLKEAHASKISKGEESLAELESKSNDLEQKIEHHFEPEAALADIEEIHKEVERLTTDSTKENPYKSELDHYAGRDFDNEIKKLEGKIDRFTKSIDSLNESIEDGEKIIKSNDEHIQKQRERLDIYDIKTQDDLNELKNMEGSLLKEINELKEKENPYDSQIKSVEDMFVNVDELKDQRASIETDIKHVTYLVRLLTDSKSFIRKKIVDRFIPYLNKKIVQYTEKLGLPHVCTINSDLSVDIEYMTKNVSYYNMSQGERMRLNIATTAALKDLLALLGTKINMMFVDEVLDSSMDSGGMFKAFDFIKEHSNNLLLISHRDELTGSVDNTITVIKRNGFSIIE